jgi:multisubunit Na+/H+ antiporter MnhF subunit
LLGVDGWQTTRNQVKEAQRQGRSMRLLIIDRFNSLLVAVPAPFSHLQKKIYVIFLVLELLGFIARCAKKLRKHS